MNATDSYQISRIVTDPPSDAGAPACASLRPCGSAASRALGFAAEAAAPVRALARLRRAQVVINGIWYHASARCAGSGVWG